jgi:hypothetical protein
MSEDIAGLIINLGSKWRGVSSVTARPLYPSGESLWYLLLQGQVVHNRFGRCGEDKNLDF